MKRTFKNFPQTNQQQKNEFLQSKTLFFPLSAIACFKVSILFFFGLGLHFHATAANYITKTTTIPFMKNNLSTQK